MTMPSLREIVHAMLPDSTLFALRGELITASLALRSCDFQPEAHSPVACARPAGFIIILHLSMPSDYNFPISAP
jgi:hypothetical protein